MNICPVCGGKSVDNFNKPIDYSACRNCHTVFVSGKDGTISALDVQVEYNPNYEPFTRYLVNKSESNF